MRRFLKPALVVVLIILTAGIFLKGTIPQPAIGNWLAAGSMTAARSGAASALLQDGRILIAGGDNGAGPVASAEVFDSTGAFVAIAPMGTARSAHSATVLIDGRVLVAGGSTGAAATNAAEIFDPATNAWSPVAGGMIQARSNHTASLLADGRVLFAGGDNAGAATASLEIFDPVANAFSSVGVMTSARTSFASAILSDGRVMLIGGSNGSAPVASTEIFDPTNNSVVAGPALSAPRMAHSATMLLDGRALVAGGTTVVSNPDGSTTPTDLASAEIYDPATGDFAVSASSLAAPRRDHAAFLLPNNNSVLIVGGMSSGNEVGTAELFLPSTGTFAVTGSPKVARQHATGNALSQDGILFLAGGSISTGTLATTELYGFATVKTDKSDYAPGEIVTITGSGWQPGETVTLTMVELPFFDSHGPFTTVADSTGKIFNNQFSPDEHDENIRFFLTAVGSISGIQAQNTFTDAITLTSETVGTQTGALNAGTAGSATYAICVNYNGNNSNITFSVLPGLPAGATVGFSSNVINNPAKCPSTSTTLTLSTTAAVAAGTYPFTVQATGGGIVSNTGALIVTGPAAKVAFTTQPSASSISGTLFAQQPAITIEDSNGNVVNSSATVSLAIGNNPGGGTLSGTTTVAAVNGVATFSGLSIDKVGNGYTLVAGSGALAVATSNTFNITGRAITVTAAANTKTYDGTTSAAATPTITSGTLAPGDTANFTETYGSKNVGTNLTLTPSGTVTNGANNVTANYTITFVNNTAGAINTRALTVTAATNTKTYDGTASATAMPTITSGAVQTGDTANFTEAYASKNAGTGLTLTPSGTVSDGNTGLNYSYTFVNNTTGVINKLALTVTAAANSKTYESNTSAATAPTITSGAVQIGDTANFTETYATKNVGTSLTLTPSGTVSDGNSGNNYSYSFVAGANGTITARSLTVTAATNTKTYDGTTSAAAMPSITSGTLQGTDTANFTESYATKTAGTGKTLTPSGTVSDGNSGNNYSYNFVNNTTGVIHAKALTVTGITASNKGYDGATAATLNTGAAALAGTIAGDIVTLNTGAATGTFANANAGTGITVTVSGLTISGADAGNYTLTQPTTTGNITQATLTYTANAASRAYNTANPTFTGTVTGFVGTDTQANATTGTLTFTSPATTASNVGSYAINGSGLTATNYNFVQAAANATALTISKATLAFNSLAISSSSMAYGTTPVTVSGKLNATPMFSEFLTITLNGVQMTSGFSGNNNVFSATFVTSTLPVSGSPYTVTINYAGDANYNSLSDTSLTLTVTKATATVSLGNLSPTYTGSPLTPTATTSPAGLTVAFTGAPDTNAGSYPVTATVNDANYQGSASGTFTINKAATTTTVGTISPEPSNINQSYSVAWTVTVNPPGGGTPTGTVTVNDGLTNCTVAVAVGSCTLASTSAGTKTITATYSGDSNFSGSAGTKSHVVNNPATTTTVSSSPNQPVFGESVTFTATVTSAGGTPTGSVTFYDSATCSGSALGGPIGLNVNGKAAFSISTLTAAPHTITACYTPTGIYLASSGSVTQVVNQAPATLMFGQLTFAYDGTPKSAIVTTSPLGLTVNITYSQNNNAVVSPTAVGSYSVVATVVDNNYQGSVTGTLVISQANLYVIPNDQMRNFSDANPTVSPASYFGFASGDNAGNSVTGTLTCQIAATSTSSAGQYAIHGCSGLSSGNYALVYANATLTITNPLVSLAVTPANPTIHIGETKPLVAVGTFQQGSRNLGAFDGAWANGSSIPTARAGAAAAEVNGQLYVISGRDGSTVVTSVDVYNPITGTWANPSPAPAIGTGRMFARAIALGGQLYVIGGCTVADCSGITGAVEAYDPNANGWSTKASMPSGTERYDAAVGVINGKLYVAGGHNAGGVIGTVEIYNPVTDTWTSGQSMGTARSAAAAGVINGLLYAAGGSDGGGPVNTLESYDPVQDSWTTLTPAPAMAAQSFVGGAVLNGVLYAVGGVDGSSNPTTTVQAYDPIGNSWTNQTSIPTGLNDGQPVAIGGLIYAAGNGSGNTPASTLQLYSPNEVTWNSATQSVATIDATGVATGVAAGTSTITSASIPFSPVNGTTVLTVTKKDQTITFAALGDKTYGDPDFTVSAASDSGLTITFIASGNCTVSGSTVHITGAGSCTITAQQAGNDTYSTATDVPRTFNIAKAHLTVKADDKSKTYDGAVFSPFTATITGFVNGENSAVVSGAPAFTGTATTAMNAGSYTITPVANTLIATNYDFTVFNSGTLTINKAHLTVKADDKSKTYDGAVFSPFTATITGFVNSETDAGLRGLGALSGAAGFTGTATTATNAGSYTITPTAGSLSATNYDFTVFYNGTLTINKAHLTVTSDSKIKTYDGSAFTAFTATITGFVNGENSGALSGAASFSGTAVGAINAGSYTITSAVGTLWATNYDFTVFNPGTLTINQANAVISVSGYTGVYDGNAHGATGSALGVESPSPANLASLLHLGSSFANVPGGPANWTFDGNINYMQASGSVAITITQATSTTTVNCPASVIYNGMAQTPCTASATGAGSLNQSLAVTYGANTNAGTASAGATFSGDINHTGSSDSKNFTINQASLRITASSGSMIYGGPVFPVSASYMGFVTGEGPLNLVPPPSCGTYATSSSTVGTYASFCSGGVDSNYNISYATGIVTVSQATTTTAVVTSVNPSTFMQLVTFTATVTPLYAGTVPTGTVTFYNNGSSIGTSPVSVTSCGMPPCPDQATFSTPGLPDSGPDNITAMYNGDGNFVTSTSQALTQTVQPAPNVSLNPMSVSFGNQNVNTTSKPASVTLKNIGDATLNISTGGISINPSTDFTQTNNCGSSVTAGASCIIYITFTPVDTGIRTATLQITDNDDDAVNAQQTVSLTGAGLSTITGTSLYTDAIFATANGCGSIVMSGGSTVDSFNSAQGFAASHLLSGGNVGTNGNVTLNGGKSAIYGSVAVPTTTTGNCSKTSLTGVTTSGGAQVMGGLVPLNSSLNYPVPPAPTPAPPTTAQNISGSCGSISTCTNTGTKTVSLAPGQYGNLNISGGTTAHFSKGTYNINSLSLTGQSILYVDSGPVVVNLTGASLSGGNAAMDASGGTIQNPSGNPANLQFTYAGSRGLNLSGGSASYATVDAPNALVNMSGGSDFFGSIIASTVTNSGGTAMHGDTSLPAIQMNNYIWFNAVVNNVSGLPANGVQVKLYLTNSSISFPSSSNQCPGMFSSMTGQCTLAVPNAVVTFNSASQGMNGTSPAKTSYDLMNNRWSTAVSKTGLTGNTFVTGVAIPVPVTFPTGIQNVAWSTSFSTDTPGITLQWQWAAAVYNNSFNTTYATATNSNALGVNAEDGSANTNGTDPAGTPEMFKGSLLFGATGGGGTNYTGYFTPGAGVVPTVAPMSVSPSSLDFGPQNQGTVSTSMITVLTNNDSAAHTIFTVAVTGTNAANFTQTNNCPTSPNTLAGGASCTIVVMFSPSDVGTRTAKIVLNDDANNSPQTVYLSGTGQ